MGVRNSWAISVTISLIGGLIFPLSVLESVFEFRIQLNFFHNGIIINLSKFNVNIRILKLKCESSKFKF